MKEKKSVIFVYFMIFLSIVFSFAFVSAKAIPPKIYSISTFNSKFTNGEFIVEYNAEDIDKAILYYGTDAKSMNQLVKTDCHCEFGRNRKCSFEPDLTKFENQEITYFFVIKDKKGNFGQSIIKKVKVDTIPPMFGNPDSMISSINKNIVNFDINIHDNNFDRIEYVNNFDSNKPVVLCRNVNSNYGCKAKKRFNKGYFVFTIIAFDKAGNSVSQDASFSVA